MASKYKGPKGSAWASQAFESKSAKAGGVVRRSVAAAKKAGGETQLIILALAKGFSIRLNGGQHVIFCNSTPVADITVPPP